MTPRIPAVTLRFDDLRLHLSVAGRSLVRIVSYIVSFLMIAAVATFLGSDVPGLRAAGVLLGLFLLDRLLHAREGDWPISELPDRGSANLARYCSPRAFHLIERAYDHAAITGRSFALAMAREFTHTPETRDALRRLDIAEDDFRSRLEAFLGEETPVRQTSAEREAAVAALVAAAFPHAIGHGHRFIEAHDLLTALPDVEDERVRRLFAMFGISVSDLFRAFIFPAMRREFGGLRRMPASLSGVSFGAAREIRHRVVNRAWTSRPTPTLDTYAEDFTDLARRESIGFLVGHEEEYTRLLDVLARPMNPNVILVGESGMGKEAIVAHLAFELEKDHVPPVLFDKRLVALRVASLVAGASDEELLHRVETIVAEIMAAGNIILYIPEMHDLTKTAGAGSITLADALMPVFAHNAFPVIGATYPREYLQFIEPRSDIAGLFDAIRVEEISAGEAETALAYAAVILEGQYGAYVSFGAVKAAVKHARLYAPEKFLPSSAEGLLKEAVVAAGRRGERTVTHEGIVRIVEEKTSVPLDAPDAGETTQLLNLEAVIHERFIDQDEAVKAVADALRSYRSGLSRKGGTIANFLFVGPTGVGKTELSKILADIEFGSSETMTRFDMTEYQEPSALQRFIGSPDGAVPGALTEAIRERPYGVILLDEFEKAHPDILNLFLQVMEDARLTDARGRTVDFSHTIIIATSNAHADIIIESIRGGKSVADITEYLKRRLTDVFKPELLNRFSKVVVFRDLAFEHMGKIAALQLRSLAKAVGEQGIALSWDEAALQWVAKKGYDPAFGARPLRRVIEDEVRAKLAERILRKEIVRGSRVALGVTGDALSFGVSS